MPRHTLSGRGFSLSVEVPGGLAAGLRRRLRRGARSRPADPLLTWVEPPPALELHERDPVAAVAPWRLRPGSRPPAGPDAPLEEQVRSRYWYHTIELPGGIVTPGEFDHRRLVAGYGLPADLRGRRALDVASYDGFWAFELERRGAEVTAVDVGRISGYDFPGPARRQLEAEGLDRPHLSGFEIARRALGSRVERITTSVYDLNPAEHGVHDLVHVADLLLHLESPTRALRAVRSVTRGTAIIADAYQPAISARDRQLVEYFGGWSIVTWWLPSLPALGQMVLDAGFASVGLHAAYVLGRAGGGGGFHRAVLVARA